MMGRKRKIERDLKIKKRMLIAPPLLTAVLEYYIEKIDYIGTPERSNKERLENALSEIFGMTDGRTANDDSNYLLEMHQLIIEQKIAPYAAARKIVHKLSELPRNEVGAPQMIKRLAAKYQKSEFKNLTVMPPESRIALLMEEWLEKHERDREKAKKTILKLLDKHD